VKRHAFFQLASGKRPNIRRIREGEGGVRTSRLGREILRTMTAICLSRRAGLPRHKKRAVVLVLPDKVADVGGCLHVGEDADDGDVGSVVGSVVRRG
jgi:hypothetical protein